MWVKRQAPGICRISVAEDDSVVERERRVDRDGVCQGRRSDVAEAAVAGAFDRLVSAAAALPGDGAFTGDETAAGAACVGLARLTGGSEGGCISSVGTFGALTAARAVTPPVAGPALVRATEATGRAAAAGRADLRDGELAGEDDTEPSAVEPLP